MVRAGGFLSRRSTALEHNRKSAHENHTHLPRRHDLLLISDLNFDRIHSLHSGARYRCDPRESISPRSRTIPRHPAPMKFRFGRRPARKSKLCHFIVKPGHAHREKRMAVPYGGPGLAREPGPVRMLQENSELQFGDELHVPRAAVAKIGIG